MSAVEARSMIPRTEYKILHQIASAHRTTVGAVIAELVHRGLQPGGAPQTVVRRRNVRVTPEILNTLVRMHQKGATDTAIHAATGMSMANIAKHRLRLNLPANRVRATSGGGRR